MTILQTILETKKREVEKLFTFPEANEFSPISKKPSFIQSVKHRVDLAIIAEIKRASPSKGAIQLEVDPVAQAIQYERAGASAISVLTDETYFRGSITDLHEVAKAVSIPVLCKDFIIDRLQLVRAKQAGASIVLLIVAALSTEQLVKLIQKAHDLDLEVLVEVHDEQELQIALSADAPLIGVNNRNLKTFEVDLARTEQLANVFPFQEDRLFISESGIHTPRDAKRAAGAGAHGVLVGEAFMTTNRLAETIKSFQVPRGVRV